MAVREEGAEKPSFVGIGRRLLEEEGFKGLYRGVLPRVANVMLWGTCMVSAYEFLKRTCALPPEALP